MTAPAFTPGPWEVVPATEHHGFYVTSQYGNTICDLYTMSQPRMRSTANGGLSKPVPFMHEMDGPNAHLIAVSPKLYEALEDVLEQFVDPQQGIEQFDSAIVRKTVERAQLALARARGEQVPA